MKIRNKKELKNLIRDPEYKESRVEINEAGYWVIVALYANTIHCRKTIVRAEPIINLIVNPEKKLQEIEAFFNSKLNKA